MRIAIFASGNGSNFQVLAEAFQSGAIKGELRLLFCDQEKAKVRARANQLKIKEVSFSPKSFENKDLYEQAILDLLHEEKINFIVLAGYMRIIGQTLLSQFEHRIINIHPSLLPNFPGLHGVRDAFEAGVGETGITIHYIDKGIDTGPIIRQEKVQRTDKDTLESLEAKIHALEHRIYPEVLAEIINNLEV